MSVSISDFWKLAYQSKLLSKDECQSLYGVFRHQTAEPDSAKAAAEWLIGQKKISVYQARTLLAGHAGPFYFGDYVVSDRMPGGDWTRRFKAKHIATDHKVLLHFLAEPESISSERWREIQAYAARHEGLTHTNLDRCYETVTRTKHKIGVSELVKGTALGDEIEQRGPLRFEEASALIRQAALGLECLHRSSLAHGRIEPENICRQSNGHVKVLRHSILVPTPYDFEDVDPKLNLDQRSNYFAPELAGPSRPPDSAADIYALGCVFFELLVGRPPFEGGDAASKMIRHAQERIANLHDAVGIPNELAEIISFMMAKNHNLRLKARDVVQRLEAFVPEAQLATPPVNRSTEATYLKQLRSRLPNTNTGPKAPVKQQTPPQKKSNAAADTIGSTAPILVEPKGTSLSTGTIAKQRRQSKVSLLLALGGVTAGIVVVAIVMASLLNSPDSPNRPSGETGSQPQTNHSKPTKDPGATESNSTDPSRDSNAESEGSLPVSVIHDDNVSLWASPTDGEALALQFLPPGTQFIAHVRMRELLSHDEGTRLLRALGPNANQMFGQWQSRIGIQPEQIESLVLAYTPRDAAAPEKTLLIRFTDGVQAEDLIKKFTPQNEGNGLLAVVDEQSVYAPNDANVWVVGTTQTVQQLIAAGKNRPLMRRGFEKLLSVSDSSRHVSLVTSPNFLLVGGRKLFRDADLSWRDSLLDLLGDGHKAISFSLHLSESFYVELRIAPRSNVDVHLAAKRLRDRFGRLPDRVMKFLGQANVHPYWQRLAERLPTMVQFAVDHGRVVPSDGQVVANLVLPSTAAHNLVLAGEMAIWAGEKDSQSSSQVRSFAIDEILDHSMTFQFDQLSLEGAVRDLASRVNEELPGANLEIRIAGGDLQLEGITRNQQIKGFSIENESVAQVLTRLLMKANPVTTVRFPTEKDQKLVWVVDPVPASAVRSLVITTRAATERKGYDLPQIFRPRDASK